MKQVHMVIWKEGGWYVAKSLEVEVASQGKSEAEATKNLQEALELYFEDNDNQDIISVNNPKLQEIPIQISA